MTLQVDERALKNSLINDQETLSGTTINPIEINKSFFITRIDGASASNPATIKDSAGSATITIISDNYFPVPFRIDGGFTITASSAVYVSFCRVAIHN